MTQPIPELDQLGSRFCYCPDSGAITMAFPRGPKVAGENAIVTQNGRPCVFWAGRYRRAEAIAWALSTGCDPFPSDVVFKDGDLRNLRFANLQIGVALRQQPKRGRSAKRPAWQKRDIRFCNKTGLWKVFLDGALIGEYPGRAEAISVRRLAASEAGPENSR